MRAGPPGTARILLAGGETSVAGHTHFITPSGRSSIVRSGSYSWGADALAVYFVANPDRLQELLPGSLRVLDGRCMAYVGEFVSVSEDHPDMAYHDPAGVIYHEAALSIACRFGEREGYFPTFMWVDKEWSLLRGWLNGYPKKLADQVVLGRRHRLDPVTGPTREGARIAGTCSRHGRELLRLGIEVQRKGTPADLISFKSTFGHRHFPATDPSQTAVSEIVEVNRTDLTIDDVWVGQGSVGVGSAWDEELDYFQPQQVLHAVLYSYGFKIKGARLLERVATEQPAFAGAR
jgi:acetoacetate decarboxylase